MTYTVTGAGDTNATGIGTALAVAINATPSPLAQAGVIALPSGAVISLNMKTALNFQVTSSNSNFKAVVIQGTASKPALVTITVTGALQKKDTVTITGVSPTQQPAADAQTAPAAASGVATFQHVQ